MSEFTTDTPLQMRRAKRALKRRLIKEGLFYRLLHSDCVIDGKPVLYNGKGDRFEFKVTFGSKKVRYYEVTVYGPGRSYRIWRL